MTGTRLYCLVTEALVCEQLAQSDGRELSLRPLESQANALTITPPPGLVQKEKNLRDNWLS